MDWGIVGLLALALIMLVTINSMRVRHAVHYGQVGLQYRDEVFVQALEPGVHRFFDPLRKVTVARISVLPSALGASQFEVISSDQFAFRITATLLYTITDPRIFHENHPRVDEGAMPYGYGEEVRMTRVNPVMAAGFAEAVATTSLEEFLADPKEALSGIAAQVEAVMPGASVDDVLVTAITLPPEVRKMFTEVERARRDGLAALERARGEQASLRALANAARNMADNPELAKLRVLQTMESAKGAKTFILGKEDNPG